jgi:hypothetical protein
MVDEARNVKMTGFPGCFSRDQQAFASGFLRDTVLHGYALLCKSGNGRPNYLYI